MQRKRIAIMTCGGDAPGLNSFISACTTSLRSLGWDVIGIKNGFEGVLKKEVMSLDEDKIQNYAAAGTILGASNRLDLHGREEEFVAAFKSLQVDGLIVSGGDGSFAALQAVLGQIPLIGVPKTIDNDLANTDQTIGFDTAVTAVVKSIDALRATADSLGRGFVVETMGRHTGWIALCSGISSFSDAILIPERPFERDALKKFILQQKKKNCVIVVSEGATAQGEKETVAFQDPLSKEKEKLGGVAFALARWLQTETKMDFRHQVIGYLQRGCPPTQTDRFLAIELGIQSARLANEGRWNSAVTWSQGRIKTQNIDYFMAPFRRVPTNHPWVLEAELLKIFI